MKRLLFVISTVLFAQTPTAVITVNPAPISIAANNGATPPVTLNCAETPNATHTQVTSSCTAAGVGLPTQVLDCSQPGESVTYSLVIGGNSMAIMLTQSTPVGTITWQVTANGVLKTGTF